MIHHSVSVVTRIILEIHSRKEHDVFDEQYFHSQANLICPHVIILISQIQVNKIEFQ